VAKRRKAKVRKRTTSFKLGTSKRGKKQSIAKGLNLKAVLKIAAVVGAVTAVGVGFVFLQQYVADAVDISQRTASLKLIDAPDWVNQGLKDKIYAAARAGSEDLELDEDAAVLVQQNIETLAVWLDAPTVQTTHDSIRISGRWRKPLALVKRGLKRFYVDSECFVLDYLPMPNLPIVEVKGLSVTTRPPSPGELCRSDDLTAAVAILERLNQMDELVSPDSPLLYEIDRIDVSNFNGRQNPRAPHIILYAKDNTEIIWGAELGSWQRYLEAPDEQKLARLYHYYEKAGSLLNSVKYINLRDPQGDIALPVDKY